RINHLQAYRLLHLFLSSSPAVPAFAEALSAAEAAELSTGSSCSVASRADRIGELRPDDWPLLEALSADGRASWRQLAASTHWHETTVRRRVEELIACGLVYFDVDLQTELLGLATRAVLWMSVAPAYLMQVGEAMATHREVPFVSVTTGPTNLVASIACRNDRALFEYLNTRIAPLEGVSHVEVEPIISRSNGTPLLTLDGPLAL
ncbi:MAG: Lrp/AsnC family transcriptional regulator, partial [Acidimicrobiales bacterium]|nr:Lrp/AsnC family transcriptional regulator [Acidimicrobiales bacterium]